MTIFSELYNRLARWRRPKPPPGMDERLSWLLQPYLHTLEDILTWKNSTHSFIFFVFANLVLWVLRTYNIRPLGIIGGSLLCAVILDALATFLGERKIASGSSGLRKAMHSTGGASRPASQLQEVVHRVDACLRYVGTHLTTMRNTNHAQFCSLVCSSIIAVCLVVWLGKGLLLHGVLSAVLLSPLIPALENDARHQSDSDGEVEGFLPELSPNVLRELNAAGEHLTDPQEYSSLMSDLSLPPVDDAILRYATGEASSSEDEGDGKFPPTPDPPSTDTTDSDTEFLLHDKSKKSGENRNQGPGGWFSASSIIPSAPAQGQTESDSDEFEIVDKDDL